MKLSTEDGKKIYRIRKILLILMVIVIIVSALGAVYKLRLGVVGKNKPQQVVLAPVNADFLCRPSSQVINSAHKWVDNDIKEWQTFSKYEYPISQYYGVHIDNIDRVLYYIDKIGGREDIDGLSNMIASFDEGFDNTINELRIREKDGIVLPAFIIDKVLKQIDGLIPENTKENIICIELSKKLDSMKEINDSEKKNIFKKIRRQINDYVYPPYLELYKYLHNLKTKADNIPGIWKFKGGDEYYKYAVKHNTTLQLTPEEIYNTGITEVERLKGELQKEFKKMGYNGKTPEENIKIFNKDKKKLLEDYKKIIYEAENKTSIFFDIKPNEGIKVMSMEDYDIETGPQAYYLPSSQSGGSEGIFYVNVDKPTYIYDMKSIAYHETIPGHHFQEAIQSEMLGEKNYDFQYTAIPAYVEGWALYAERLADEAGLYEDNYSRIGYLRGELLRAVRLVIDTGIHYKRWTRNEAIEYMKSMGCIPDEYLESEIDRYIVIPGEACSYKIGQLKILELRDKAAKELGSRFNIKEFHNIILRNGPVPLSIMEDEIRKYIYRN